MDNFVIRKNRHLKDDPPINIYTDGACINNGKPDANAGFGVWFGENDVRNVSESFSGKQTNNIAELLAIIKALTIVRNQIEGGQPINIYSDSSYAIRCCTTYGEKCFKKNWKNPNAKNKPIPNLEIIKVAYSFCKKHNNINFIHVNAHTGNQDEHSIGNDHADRLANLAVGVKTCPYANIKKKIYLNIPYDEKDEGKKMGAKWDSKKKKWFMQDNNKYKIQMLGRWGIEN